MIDKTLSTGSARLSAFKYVSVGFFLVADRLSGLGIVLD